MRCELANDYIGPGSVTRWIIEKSWGFIDIALLRISESVRAYAYLILSLQASARSCMVGNTVNALTVQKAFPNNFENVVNRRVDIQEDIKWYQNTLSYTSSKVDYSMGLSIYMLPIDMNLNIRSGTVRYKILVSDSGFSLGKNNMVNPTVPEKMALLFQSMPMKHSLFILCQNTPQPSCMKRKRLLWYPL